MDRQIFENKFDVYLREHFYVDRFADYFKHEESLTSIVEHLRNRENWLGAWLLDWIGGAYNLNGKELIEIGCGTGSSTAVFVPVCKSITCYEISDRARRAAEYRADLLSWTNVSFETEPFGRNCSLAKSNTETDAVLFSGVLEHLDFPTLEDILSTAFKMLRPGGIIIVIGTPNRLTITDLHTSFLPFFQYLPIEVRERYFEKSSRAFFVDDISDCRRKQPFKARDLLYEWGNGISYHEFEIILGEDVNSWIVADGWEDLFIKFNGTNQEDDRLLQIWDQYNIKANKAFARSWLNFIIQKPLR